MQVYPKKSFLLEILLMDFNSNLLFNISCDVLSLHLYQYNKVCPWAFMLAYDYASCIVVFMGVYVFPAFCDWSTLVGSFTQVAINISLYNIKHITTKPEI